mgnify:CR=1 FL=1
MRLTPAPGTCDKILQVDLKAHSITDYGELGSLAGGMKLFCNGRRMPLARWPNEGWALACSAEVLAEWSFATGKMAKERKLGNRLAFKHSGGRPNRWSILEGV